MIEKICPYCNERPLLKRKNGRTCGNKDCQKAKDTEQGKEYRKNIPLEKKIIYNENRAKKSRAARLKIPKIKCRFCENLFRPVNKYQFSCSKKSCKYKRDTASVKRKSKYRTKKALKSLKPQKCITCKKKIPFPKIGFGKSCSGKINGYRQKKTCSYRCFRDMKNKEKKKRNKRKLLEDIKTGNGIAKACIVCAKPFKTFNTKGARRRTLCNDYRCRHILGKFNEAFQFGFIPKEMAEDAGDDFFKRKFKCKNRVCVQCGKNYKEGFKKYCSGECAREGKSSKNSLIQLLYRNRGKSVCNSCGRLTLSKKRKEAGLDCWACFPYQNVRHRKIDFYLKNFKLVYIRKPDFFTGKIKRIGRIINKNRSLKEIPVSNKAVLKNTHYPKVKISKNKQVNEHIISFILAHKRFPDKHLVVHHKDHIKENSCPKNLMECTVSENLLFANEFYNKGGQYE